MSNLKGSLGKGRFPSFRDILVTLVPILGWVPALAFLLYSVWFYIHGKYMKAILLASGRQAASESTTDLAFLFREDLLWFGVVAPLLIALLWHLGSKWIRWLIVALTLIVLLGLYANLQSWGQIGHFLSLSALIDGLSFAVANPEIASYYISAKGLIKLAIVMALTLLMFGLTPRIQRTPWLGNLAGGLALLIVLASAAISQLGYSAGLRDTFITRSFMINAAHALTSHGADGTRFATASDAELDAALERLLNHPRATNDPRAFGLERGSNLLLFVLETASIEFLDTREELPPHPVWSKLSASRYIGANHYSTFPASAESNLSILTGLYPPRAYYSTCMADRLSDNSVATVIGSLRQQGSKTAVYAPYISQVPMDRVVFESTGFEKVFYAQSNPLAKKIGADRVALNELLSDLRGWGQSKQRFVAAFYPQEGHGPWRSTLGPTVKARGHAVVMKQLDWLESLVDTLKSQGVLDNTVIVLTGDHGVRTLQEDPNAPVGMIDAYSLHVPLLIFAPHAGYDGRPSFRPTSHVDVSAELAYLMGVKPQAMSQGLSLMDPAIDTRRQFFMANWYFGADGYRRQNESAMFNTELGIAYRRSDGVLRFDANALVVDAGQEAHIRDTLSEMLDLQAEWIKRRVCANATPKN